MELFDVYPQAGITPERGSGCTVWDTNGTAYLDLYGGHAVISIGHSHPLYIERITGQLQKLGFYSNMVRNPLQEELAEKLGRISGYDDYQLFLCNSGAEANENAIKAASFYTGRKQVIAFSRGFHGRTSAAVALTDNPKIVAPVNQTPHALILPFNDLETVGRAMESGEVAAVILEGIQGVGGIHVPDEQFLMGIEALCHEHGSLLILDEIQSGYGRSGKFFAHQFTSVRPDLITMAKGMGNGFPIGAVMIHPGIRPWHGMLGTTFGGNHLACAAAIAVLDVMKSEQLIENAAKTGSYLLTILEELKGYFTLRGRGLMIGLEFPFPIKDLRNRLLYDFHIFTGFSGQNTLRLLPPLTLSVSEADHFAEALASLLPGYPGDC